jgi:hypothetical protein
MARRNRHAPTNIIESSGEHIAAADQPQLPMFLALVEAGNQAAPAQQH